MHDLVDPPGRDNDLLRQLRLAHAEGIEKLFEQGLARMHGGMLTQSPSSVLSVVVNHLDVFRPRVGSLRSAMK